MRIGVTEKAAAGAPWKVTWRGFERDMICRELKIQPVNLGRRLYLVWT
jgi:hypothetical protein